MLRDRLNTVIIYCTLMLVCGCQWLPEVGSVRLSESNVTLKVGGSKILSAVVEPAAAEYEGIIWHTSDPSVVLVSNGRIVAEKVGSATITASAAGVSSAPCQVTVDATHVTGISLSNYSVEITEGESITLKATVSPSDATDPSFSWISDNTSVATVQNGKIVAISPGNANISVKTTDGNKTATCKVTVKSKVIDVTGITLSQSSVSVKEEATVQLKATVNPSNATNQKVSWSSADTGIAIISSDGTVTGVTEGTTTITAKSADGKVTATCKVTVTAEYVDIPDPNFRKYMVDNFDLNKNGKISMTEARKVKTIKVATVDIESLDGIEYLENLTRLDISNYHGLGEYSHRGDGTPYHIWQEPSGKIESLNLSNNKMLTDVDCRYNRIQTIDISNLSHLTRLDCSANQIERIDVGLCPGLTYLNCSDNLLKHLDVSSNSALVELWCDVNQISELDITRNVALTTLSCDSNQLNMLDISASISLAYLNFGVNRITEIDLSKNTALTHLSCYSNKISSLDISSNKSLDHLFCSWNNLSFLDVSNNKALNDLYCGLQHDGRSINVVYSQGQPVDKWCEGFYSKDVIWIPEEVYNAPDWNNLKLNEVYGAGADEEKYFELYNAGDVPIKLIGVTIKKDEELTWTGIDGEVVPAKSFFAIVGAKKTNSRGFASGFSAKKSVLIELFDPKGNKIDFFQRGEIMASGEWGASLSNNNGSWSRIPDGSGQWKKTATKTPGATNSTVGEDDPDIKQ